ncbi:LacI family DNA-binding transcriptional regulator [Agromyces sp. NPDC058484]|uniref:LacI family DNA-binding transcriptional regulator n=1 Tax=Agromyces sp. NPDC058484 TaxID=3346524 RepID=UPI0036672D4F
MSTARRPTLADVAALAGTSTAVVSYVVNDGPRTVAPGTRRRVEAAIETLGYRRNLLAGALSAGRSNLVALLVPDSSNAFFSELARQVEGEGNRRGLLTLLGNAGYDADAEQEYLAAFSDLRPRGVLVASISGEHEAPVDCPRVYLHSAPAHTLDRSVVFDDAAGARAAVEHLLDHGHRRIQCVTGPSSFGPSGRREEGWRAAIDAVGATGALYRTSFERVEAERAMLALLDSPDRPAAVFATTDELALATLRAAAVLGVRVPQELAIVGYDGIREALYGSVRLTTVCLPLERLAAEAFEALERSASRREVAQTRGPDVDRASGSAQADALQVVLHGTLRVGETCGCGIR